MPSSTGCVQSMVYREPFLVTFLPPTRLVCVFLGRLVLPAFSPEAVFTFWTAGSFFGAASLEAGAAAVVWGFYN